VRLLHRLARAGTVPEGERIAFYELYFDAVKDRLTVADDPQLRSEAHQVARRVLGQDGIFGSALHFGAWLDPKDLESLSDEQLVEHVLYLANRGKSPALDLPGIERSLDVLAQRFEPQQMLELSRSLITADPSAFRLWVRHARILLQLRDLEQAEGSVRWILGYIESTEAATMLAEILARRGEVSDVDDSVVQQVLAADGGGAGPRRALGLIHWRRGRLQECVDALPQAAATLDSFALYARACARIGLGTAAQAAAAATDLEELASRAEREGPGEAAGLLLALLRNPAVE
jgi:hypothetical protein